MPHPRRSLPTTAASPQCRCLRLSNPEPELDQARTAGPSHTFMVLHPLHDLQRHVLVSKLLQAEARAGDTAACVDGVSCG